MKGFVKILGLSLLIAFVLFVIDVIFDFASNREVVFDFQLVKVFGYYVMPVLGTDVRSRIHQLGMLYDGESVL